MITPDLELEIAQKDIQISHLQERLRFVFIIARQIKYETPYTYTHTHTHI
jgi:hypothetical protein